MEDKELQELEEFTLEDIIREFSDHPVEEVSVELSEEAPAAAPEEEISEEQAEAQQEEPEEEIPQQTQEELPAEEAPVCRVRRCPWCHYSQAPQRWPHRHRCQGFRRCRGIYEGSPGHQHQQRHRRTEGKGRLGIRYRCGGFRAHVPGGSYRTCRHCGRQRG